MLPLLGMGPRPRVSLSVVDRRLGGVDPLVGGDAVAAHRLPHAELEHLHVEGMKQIGDR